MKPTKKRNRLKPRRVRRQAHLDSQQAHLDSQQAPPGLPRGEPTYEEFFVATETLLKVQREFLRDKEAVILELPDGGAFITLKTIGERGWWE